MFCPLPASVETIGLYLGYLYRHGSVVGTSIRPCLPAVCTIHIRAGFPSPTDDTVSYSLRSGYYRATAERVTSRPSSVALQADIGLFAVHQDISNSGTSSSAATAVGFFLGLRPMSIQGIQADDLTLTPSDLFIRFRREKGKAGQLRDRVICISLSGDANSKLFRRLSSLRPGQPISASLQHSSIAGYSSSVAKPRSHHPRYASSPVGLFAADAFPRPIPLACPFHASWPSAGTLPPMP
jgi:hypothetical protein